MENLCLDSEKAAVCLEGGMDTLPEKIQQYLTDPRLYIS